jgi:leucyl aminopeptidase
MPVEASVALEGSIGPIREVAADVLVVPVFEGDDLSDLQNLASAEGEMGRALSSGEFAGRLYDTHFVALAGKQVRRALLVGAGQRANWMCDRLRRAAAAAAHVLRKRSIATAALVVRGVDPFEGAQAAADGLTLADFTNAMYKTSEPDGAMPRKVAIIAPGADAERLSVAIERGRVIGESCNLARALCNEPGNVLTPRVFAERAEHIARGCGLGVEILDERRIAELKMGLLLGVARGSAEPPRVIVLRHEPAGAPTAPVLGLVGKGITFDTGGISIKPAEGMDRMKDDMAGGAAVLTAMRAMSILGAPIRVIGVIPSTENMPGGRAFKPGDVLVAANGKTIEVNNTDAEGRLVLGDGLWLAHQLGATHLVDVATLTGACMVALGRVVSGVFGAPDAWLQHVRTVAETAGDRCWPLPLHEEYLEQLRSEIADLVNSGGRPAGAITAAMFLKEFTDGLPWAHLDVAGTAWADEAKPFQPKGATGVGVRALTALAFSVFPG